MEEAVRARGAAREAIEDITPAHLRDHIDGLLESSTVVPGVVTLLSARAVESGAKTGDVEARAAGVQLIYEGLGLTRTLARDEPWNGEQPYIESNIAVLAADVMVSRGFSLLARTEAADTAVRTVKSFGRDQTERRTEHALETDVFELAMVAGTTAAGHEVPTGIRRYAEQLATSVANRDSTELLFDEAVDTLTKLSGRHPNWFDETTSSATDP
ncbi:MULTISPECIES: hypothetical protein [unclassified Haladaptatus]|uniref:DUF7114 family protein n=1 Tax=unclassified Haladaptatus TaxID=2622732 RepID=UPI00209C5188|nr:MULTISPECIES: hypothetical protein [unclassified Haladaptatus]MCO8242958.1 hypothetical protein [Haladaptatus sp. AB643]MCO8252713.1 hypothetical protein [Haladaptatus sp. AB618]